MSIFILDKNTLLFKMRNTFFSYFLTEVLGSTTKHYFLFIKDERCIIAYINELPASLKEDST